MCMAAQNSLVCRLMLPLTVATQVRGLALPIHLPSPDSQSLFCTLYAGLALASGVMVIQAHIPVNSVLFYWVALVCTAALFSGCGFNQALQSVVQYQMVTALLLFMRQLLAKHSWGTAK